MQNGVKILTVLLGFKLAILRACSIAYSDGLQMMGVLGNVVASFWLAKWPIMSNISFFFVLELIFDPTNSISSSSSEAKFLWVGLRVSKQIIPSKQSSNPSLSRALMACVLSAFVNIYMLRWRT